VVVGRRRAAEEHHIEIVEPLLRQRRHDRRLVRHLRQRAGILAGGVEERDLRERKGPLAQDGLDLVADERERIDDAEPVAGGGLWVRHAARFTTRASRAYQSGSAGESTSSGSVRSSGAVDASGGGIDGAAGKAIDQSFTSGPEAR